MRERERDDEGELGIVTICVVCARVKEVGGYGCESGESRERQEILRRDRVSKLHNGARRVGYPRKFYLCNPKPAPPRPGLWKMDSYPIKITENPRFLGWIGAILRVGRVYLQPYL